MNKIDLFNHFFPKEFFDRYIDTGGIRDIGKRVRNIQAIHDLEFRFQVMDGIRAEYGDYCQVLTLPAPPIEALGDPKESPEIARVANDGLADLVLKHPDRFIAFCASLPLNNPDAAIVEMDRAVTLGAKGIQIFTNMNGKALDHPEVRPIIEEAARRDLAILMHPTRGANFPDYQTETKSEWEIWWTLGWPYETSAAMSRITFSGMLEKMPDLKIVTHHLGGMIPYFEGRVGPGWDQLGSRTSDRNLKAETSWMGKNRPIDYLRKFFGDTALFGARAGTVCGLEFFGVNNVLFASDTPFEPRPGMFIRETIKVLDSLNLTGPQREQIYEGNARRLLKLDGPTPAA